MYRNKKLLLNALAASVLLHGAAALASTRHYDARCQGPDGSEFMLRAQYQYRHITLGQVASVHDAQDWEIGFRPNKPGASERRAPARIRFVAVGVAPACREVGVLDGTPVVSESFLQGDGSWFPVGMLPPSLRQHFNNREHAPAVRQQLERLNASGSSRFALLVPRQGRLLYERPLLSLTENSDGMPHVSGAMRSSSPDNARTWSEPVYGRESELFVIGKPLAAQPYAAHLVSHNMPAR
jgi:hypothetical protein